MNMSSIGVTAHMVIGDWPKEHFWANIQRGDNAGNDECTGRVVCYWCSMVM